MLFYYVFSPGLEYRSEAYSSAKYVWPLYVGDPHLEITTYESAGESGCSVLEGITHPSLSYNGVSLSGNVQSYVDIVISSANELKAFAITLTMYPLTTTGSTLIHYHHDPNLDDIKGSDITDIIFSFNTTTVILDAYGPNNVNIAYMEIEHQVMVNTWDMISLVYDFDKGEMTVLSRTSKSLGKVKFSSKYDQLMLPGYLRIGAPIGEYRFKGFQGHAVCLVVHDTTFGHGDMKEILAECSAWDISKAKSGGKILPYYLLCELVY